MSLHVPLKHSDELQAAGWTRRFTAIGRRLNEAVELYRQLGFEILLDAVELDDDVGTRQRAVSGESSEFLWGPYTQRCQACGTSGIPAQFTYCGVCSAKL